MDNAPFNNLPFELYQQIFEYLDIIEVFRLKFISKKFNEIIKLFKIKELIFDFNKFNYKYKLNDHCNINCLNSNMYEFINLNDNFNSNWFNTTKPINFKNMINLTKFNFLKTSSFNSGCIKYLRISFLDVSKSKNELDFRLIEKFTNLVHFEITFNRQHNFSFKFSLPNLKVLLLISLINNSSNTVPAIEMDLPKLESLYLNNFKLDKDVKFSNPLTIKYLKINRYIDEIEILKNLVNLELYDECLYQSYYKPFKLNKNILNILTKLEQLSIRSLPRYDFYFNERTNEYSELMNIMKYIMKQKLVLRRINFKLYLRNIELINNENIINCFKNSDSIELILNNYELSSDNINWIHSFDYNKLQNQFNHKLPNSFFNKFNNLNEIKIDKKIEDKNNLIKFINNYKNLMKLSFSYSGLNSEFYENQLPKLCPQLFILEINDNESLKLINSNFLLKFEYLKEFSSNFLISLEAFIKLYKFNYLEHVTIRKESYTVSLGMLKGRKKFKIYCSNEIGYPKMSINFNEFIKSINYLNRRIHYLLLK